LPKTEITEYYFLIGITGSGGATILQQWPHMPSQDELDTVLAKHRTSYVRLVLAQDIFLIDGTWAPSPPSDYGVYL
jgi:hypothetical protein